MLRPRPRVVVEFVEVVVAHDQRVLGQLLVEALGLRAVDEEVQRLSHGAQRQEGKYRPHLCSSSTSPFSIGAAAAVGAFEIGCWRSWWMGGCGNCDVEESCCIGLCEALTTSLVAKLPRSLSRGHGTSKGSFIVDLAHKPQLPRYCHSACHRALITKAILYRYLST